MHDADILRLLLVVNVFQVLTSMVVSGSVSRQRRYLLTLWLLLARVRYLGRSRRSPFFVSPSRLRAVLVS